MYDTTHLPCSSTSLPLACLPWSPAVVVAALLRYLCEFHELHSPLRPARVQGGERGHHGHAVLSKLDMHSFTTIHHAHQPVDWEKEGERRKEPRRGRRVSMRVVVELGCGERLLLYNSHFEVFAGLLDRVHILADLFADARQQSSSCPNQAILADCNTSTTPHTAHTRAADAPRVLSPLASADHRFCLRCVRCPRVCLCW